MCVCVYVYIYVFGRIYKYIHTHTMLNYIVMRKKNILSFEITRMDIESIILSEISQTETNTI